MTVDQFGNEIDASVGYARGTLLSGSADEVRRLNHAGQLAAEYVRQNGIERIAICTGNLRYFPVTAEDLHANCEEWVGPGIIQEELRQTAIHHFGGDGNEAVGVLNRTSAGIISTILTHAKGRPILSLVPQGDRSHASVVRGSKLANVNLCEVNDLESLSEKLQELCPSLVIVTPVTSELNCLPDALVYEASRLSHESGCLVLLDEAYGARFRPVFQDGAAPMSFGADLVITNADKAGLSGPRAGVLCGREDAVLPVLAKAGELGMEARAPIAVGAMRSLQRYSPNLLIEEAMDGKLLTEALAEEFGLAIVSPTPLGPKLDEQKLLAHVMQKANMDQTERVPAEITAAIGMLLLKRHGVLTVNTHGQPGGRVSIRLKPTSGAIKRAGGISAIVSGFCLAVDEVANYLDDRNWFSTVLFGEA